LATGWVFCSLGPRHSLVSRARRAHHHHHVGPGIPGGGSAPRRDPRVWVVACAVGGCVWRDPPRAGAATSSVWTSPPPRGISRAATPARCSAARIGSSFVSRGAFTRVVYPLFFQFLHRGSGGLVRRRGACTWKVGAATVALKIRRDYK